MWNVEWNALSARIVSLVEAATYLVRALGEKGHDSFGTNQQLLDNAIDIRERILQFEESYGSQLPPPAKQCLANFIAWDFPGKPRGLAGLHAAVTVLASLRAELSYLLNDTETIGRSLVARAFSHLQRSIVADAAFRDRWKAAFQDREPVCEKLGACHLLLHGVWAFKASAQGERTDLVLGTPLSVTNLNEARAAADALVLTEWKVIRAEGELDEKAEQAYQQARRYSRGILAGFELSTRRYLVMVSNDFLPMPAPHEDDSVIYQYFNIAVSPSSPCHV